MMSLDEISRLRDEVAEIRRQYPDSRAVDSIFQQLQYLIEFLRGDDAKEWSNIETMNFGVLAVRNFDGMEIAEGLSILYSDVLELTRHSRIWRLRDDVLKLKRRHSSSGALGSIVEQLEYLIRLERGEVDDRSRIAQLNFGDLAAHIEAADRGLAERLRDLSIDAAAGSGAPRSDGHT